MFALGLLALILIVLALFIPYRCDIQGMPIQTTRHEPLHPGRHLLQRRTRRVLTGERAEHARSRSAHRRIAELLQPFQAVHDLRVPSASHRLQIVMALVNRKGRYFDGFGIACQFGGGEDFCCGNRHLGDNHEVPGGLEVKRMQVLADSLGEGITAENEKRDIGTQLHCQRLQLIH